jgi:hypothetical protein
MTFLNHSCLKLLPKTKNEKQSHIYSCIMFHHICIYIFKALKDKRTDVVSQLKYLQSETELITKIFEDPEVIRQVQSSR